ncbi:hypothetical protein AHAS_Ahas18G0109900 [Arachis hypogaea]
MSCSRQFVLDHITVQLAPRAADEIWFGSGQYDMGQNCRQSEVRSKDICSWWAFREAPWNYQFLGGRPNKHMDSLSQHFFHLVYLHGSIKPIPPSILDLRAAKHREFQQLRNDENQTALKSNS